jgi:rhomboid protease GluP
MTTSNDVEMSTPAPQPQTRQVPLPLAQPRATYVLLALIILVFLAMTAAGGSENPRVLILFGANVNSLIAAGQVWRLFTSMFLHIGYLHLFFNGYALYIFGIQVERLYGSPRFLAIYLLAGLYGSLASFAFGPPGLSAGASGALFGLLGAMLAFFRRHRETFGTWGRRQLVNLLVLAGINLVISITVPGIDILAHLGGLVSGAVLGWVLAPQYQPHVDENGAVYATDTVSLLNRWWVVALALFLLAGGTAPAMVAQR